MEGPRFRIGELSRRAKVSPELLRAWETRYGLLVPERTRGGLRLYTEEDEWRVREMSRQIAAGLSAAEAARVVLAVGSALPMDRLLAELDTALTALDEPAAQAALDRIFAGELEIALENVILPFLRTLGERWAATERSVAQEHFASNVIGGRLRALARRWGEGDGRRALLACPAGEQHELGLICFGLLLRQRGWSITYFGAQTPGPDLASAIPGLSPALVVFSATGAQLFLDAAGDIRALSSLARVAIGGAGASRAVAKSLGVELLPGGLVAAAAEVSGTAS